MAKMQASFAKTKENVPPDVGLDTTTDNQTKMEVSTNSSPLKIRTTKYKRFSVQKNVKERDIAGAAQMVNFAKPPVRITRSRSLLSSSQKSEQNNTSSNYDDVPKQYKTRKLFDLHNETQLKEQPEIKKRDRTKSLDIAKNTGQSSNKTEMLFPPLKKKNISSSTLNQNTDNMGDINISKVQKIQQTKSQEVATCNIGVPLLQEAIDLIIGNINTETGNKRGKKKEIQYDNPALETFVLKTEEVNTVTGKKRGRPKQIQSDNPTLETIDLKTGEVNTVIEKKRGRPKKIQSDNPALNTYQSDCYAISMQKEHQDSEKLQNINIREKNVVNTSTKEQVTSAEFKRVLRPRGINETKAEVVTTSNRSGKYGRRIHNKINNLETSSENKNTKFGQTSATNTCEALSSREVNKKQITDLTTNKCIEKIQIKTNLQDHNQNYESFDTTSIKQEVLSTQKYANNLFSQKQENTLDIKQQNLIDSINETYEENLKTLLSNLSLDIVNRLHLKFPLYCIENFPFCVHNHYNKELPEIDFDGIKCALQNNCYKTALFILWDVCKHNVFPGEQNLKKIIDLILSLNPRDTETECLIEVCAECFDIFKYIVRTFPPCYVALRERYRKFINLSIDVNLLTPERPILTKSNDMINQLLDLLKYTMEQCSSEDLSAEAYVYTPLNDLCDDSFSEFKPDWLYEEVKAKYQTFMYMETGLQLERIFMVLNLILSILEHDLAMWFVHNYKTPGYLMFYEKIRPLIVEAFKLQKCHYSTSTSAYFIEIFINAINKGLHHERLEILERYLGLLMVACNSAEIEVIGDDIKYPNVGNTTKHFIKYFFIKVKGAPGTTISTFLTIIKVLQIPFFRYEFIDLFLSEYCPRYNAFKFDNLLTKIYSALTSNIWEQHQRKTQLSGDDLKKILSSDDILYLLLLLFKSYNEFYGLESFMEVLVTDKVECIATNNTQYISMEKYDLESMEQNIDDLVQNFNDAQPLNLNKLKLSANIYVDEEIRSGYYNKMKTIAHIKENVNILFDSNLKNFDITDWAEYLQKFNFPI
ncbi:uncharacterized protein LOC119668339 [Teleopsis dalmanni]|uniref:uncharacterized protein LOC119668339 n=1 Tax=Teleopsis dalmanni TaxID=139649 RepID=UPI0018CF043A|nr:uncharacterized protein LOC119668339 [Teleopsis dalmanni]